MINNDLKTKHRVILNRIFRNPSQNDDLRMQRRSDRNKIEKRFRDDILQVHPQNHHITGIVSQLKDIASISKFHDEHFQIGGRLPRYQDTSTRSHISLRVPRKLTPSVSIANPSQRMLSSKNLSQTTLTSPKMSREQLLQILNKHKQVDEAFTFKRFQQQFQTFWEQRMSSLTMDEREMLMRLQNKAVRIVPEEEHNAAKQLDQLQSRMKAEFESLYKQVAPLNQNLQFLLKTQKRAQKPLLVIRCEQYLKDYVASKAVSPSPQEEVEPQSVPEPSIASFKHRNSILRRPTTTQYNQPRNPFIDRVQGILTDEPLQVSENAQLQAKIDRLFRIGVQDLIDEMNKTPMVSGVATTKNKTPALSEYQRSMRKCDEILDRNQHEMPLAGYDEMKAQMRMFRSAKHSTHQN